MSRIEPGRIRARDLGRRFTIAAQGGRSLKATLLRREHAKPREFWAVRHVDLDIQPGEAFGIVGRNGSGKSTLLKMLARIYGPSEGDCEVGGRLSSLLELGAGFHPEFSAIENIYLSAAIYGIPRDEVARDIESIIDFAELEEFKDQPVKTFSSGMYARLGFSVAMHVKPDVLLLDEVFAVGDEGFVRKCVERLVEYRRDGGTMILVTHDAETVERVCDRALLLEHGTPVVTAAPPTVIDRYRERLAATERGTPRAPTPVRRSGSGDLRIESVALIVDGQAQEALHQGTNGSIRLEYEATRRFDNVIFGLGLRTRTGIDVISPNTDRVGQLSIEPGPGFAEFTFEPVLVTPGDYDLVTIVLVAGQMVDVVDAGFSVTVKGPQSSELGLFRQPGTWTIKHSSPSFPDPVDEARR